MLLYKKSRLTKCAMRWGIALWVYTVFLLFITVIGRYSFDDYRARLIPFESYREYLATGSLSELRGIIGNVLMFIPFSFLCAQFVSCLNNGTRKGKLILIALLVGIILTATIEFLQYLTQTGTFELDDIMHNVFGTGVGVLFWIIIDKAKSKLQR